MRRRGVVWATIGGLALAVRLAYVREIRDAPAFTLLVGDGLVYDAWGRTIAGGAWLGAETFYQAPLYPYFLGVVYALAGHDLLALRVVQAALGAAACVLLGLAGARLFRPAVGIAAAAALAVYPIAVWADGLVQKSVLDVFGMCALLAALGAAHARAAPAWWLACGVALGALALTRENALAFVPVLAGWIATRPRPRGWRLRALAWAAAGLVVALGPVAVRNRVVGGELLVTTAQFGPNFYIGNNPTASGMYEALRYGRGDAQYERQDATELAEAALGRRLTPGEVSAYWRDRALDFVRREPLRWLALLGRKTLLFVDRGELGDAEDPYTYADWSRLLALHRVVHFGVVLPLAVAGMLLAWRRAPARLLIALAGVYAATVVATFVAGRYRHPILPVLLLFAADGVLRLRRLAARRAWRTAAPALVAAAAVAVVANLPIEREAGIRTTSVYNLARRLEEQPGGLEGAIAYYRRAVALAPDFAPAQNNLGLALARAGRPADGVPHVERAVALRPEQADYHGNLAATLADAGALERAIAAYDRALALAPRDADLHANLGVLHQRRGDLAAAERHYEAALAANPRHVRALANLGALHGQAGRLARAVAVLEAAVALDPRAASAQANLATALAAAGRLEDAAGAWTRLVALAPDDLDARRGAAETLAALGRHDAALPHVRAIVGRAPDSADAVAMLARLLVARPHATAAEVAEAVALAERARALGGPAHAGARQALAETQAAAARAGR